MHLRALVVGAVLPSPRWRPPPPRPRPALDGYRVKATAKNLQRPGGAGLRRDRGPQPRPRHDRRRRHRGADRRARSSTPSKLTRQPGATARDHARRPTDGATDAAFDVWTKYDAVADDDKEQYTEQYARILADFPAIAAAARRRDDLRRPRHRRPADHQGRHGRGHRRPPRRPLQRHAARPRVAGRRDLPAHAGLLRRQLRQGHERGPRGHAPRRQRPSCGSSASTTPTATSTRSRPATACGARTCATTTPTA